MAHVQARHQGGSRRRTNTGTRVELWKLRPLRRHAVEVRRLNQLLSVAAKITLREIVTENEDDVGLLGSVKRRTDKQRDGYKAEDFHGRLTLTRFTS